MSTQHATPAQTPPAKPPASALDFPVSSEELARELTRLETAERQLRDRQREEELARLRELARFD